MAQTMEVVNDGEMYFPTKFAQENCYKDVMPSSLCFANGMRCMCGSRRDKIFHSKSLFKNHLTTQCHLNWVKNLNMNVDNHFIECQRLSTEVGNLKKINTLQNNESIHLKNEIAKLKHEIQCLKQDKQMNLQFIQSLTQQQLRESTDNNIMDLS